MITEQNISATNPKDVQVWCGSLQVKGEEKWNEGKENQYLPAKYQS